MRILFLTLSFSDLTQGDSFYGDIVKEFGRQGHNITAVAPLKGDGETYLQDLGNIKTLWVKSIKQLNVSPIRKGIANLLLPYQYEKAITKYLQGNFDLIIIPTPPITFSSLATKLKKKWNAKVYLILRDIFPQNAKDLQMINNPLVFSFFRRKEKQLYKISDQIGCMSQGNIDFVKIHNPEVDSKKLHLLPNWCGNSDIPFFDKEKIKEKYGLKDKFVALFGGNIGRPQRFENLLELAKRASVYRDVVFMFVGAGTEFNRLQQEVENNKIDNVVVKKSIPRADFEQLTAACDLGLISLDQRFTIPNIPSKTISYAKVSVPILASVDVSTDYGFLLQDKMKAGLWAPAGEHGLVFNAFERLYKDKSLRDSLGKNGRDYLIHHLMVDKSYQKIMEAIGYV